MGNLLPLADELRQSLTAATNYINAARLLLSSPGEDTGAWAERELAHAEDQLLRAGDVVRLIELADTGVVSLH